jgi:hypothetical protein
VGIAIEASGGVAEQRLSHPGVGVGVLAERVEAMLTRPAGAAGDGEGDDDAVADADVVNLRTDLDDLAHELVAEDVAFLHGGNEAVVEVEVGAADGGGGDAHDGVAGIENFGVGHVLDLDIACAHPAGGFHGGFLSLWCGEWRIHSRLWT